MNIYTGNECFKLFSLPELYFSNTKAGEPDMFYCFALRESRVSENFQIGTK